MPLYEMSDQGLRLREPGSYAVLGIYERKDLQRVLRDYISALGDDLLVIAEEFSNWEDARRRIDLLAIDKRATLVVIELKRTEDGGHMELQALRYAGMVSSMSFTDVVAAYDQHLRKIRSTDERDALVELKGFLGVTDDDNPVLGSQVRVILASADFDREITTTVLWLNGFEGMDIRCVRLVPYDVDGRVLIDVQQVIPLPEAADYQVRLRRKDAERERATAVGRDYTKFEIVTEAATIGPLNKRASVLEMVRQLVQAGASVSEVRGAMPKREAQRAWRVVDGVYEEESDVRSAMLASDPKADFTRWFTDAPIPDLTLRQTFVLSSQWGSETEGTLATLVDAFPESGVTFRRAEGVAAP